MTDKKIAEPLEKKIGIRSGSRVMTLIVMLFTAIFFVGRHSNDESSVVVKAIPGWYKVEELKEGEEAIPIGEKAVDPELFVKMVGVEKNSQPLMYIEDTLTKWAVPDGKDIAEVTPEEWDSIDHPRAVIIFKPDPDRKIPVTVSYQYWKGDPPRSFEKSEIVLGHPKLEKFKKAQNQANSTATTIWKSWKEETGTLTRDKDWKHYIKTTVAFLGSVFAWFTPAAVALANDLPTFVGFVLQIVGWIIFFSLIPGLAGSFYRANFSKYFLGSVIVLLGVEVIHLLFPQLSSIAEAKKNELTFAFRYYFIALSVFAVWFLLANARIHNILRGPLAMMYERWVGKRKFGELNKAGGKNIVICLDGTWNHPGQMDYGRLANTNVFKLFQFLKGDALKSKLVIRRYNANLVKTYENPADKSHRQIGLYYNGVGSKLGNSQLAQIVGGAFGMGADSIKERAYLDIVKEYKPGDRIYIFGFSRGAALARLVAGAVGRRGIPRTTLTLRLFGQIRPILTLFGKYENVKVNVLGCWDTVGAFGIAKNILGIPFQKIDLLKDLTVGPHVERAYHLVSLDEERDAFAPTLMDPDPVNPERIEEVWFSGNHSNVGGGFATDGLSNSAMSFMLEHVSSGYHHEGNRDLSGKIRPMGNESWGIYLAAIKCRKVKDGETGVTVMIGENEHSVLPVEAETAEVEQRLLPNPNGKIRTNQGGPYDYEPRKLPPGAVIHDSVFARMEDQFATYAPKSVFLLAHEIAQTRRELAEKIEKLREIKTLSPEQIGQIEKWNSEVTIRKWSSVHGGDRLCDVEKKLSNITSE